MKSAKALLVLAAFAVVLGITVSFAAQASPTAFLLGMYDNWLHYGPYAVFMDYAIHHGELPLWNPLINCGTPYAPYGGSWSPVFYPPYLIRSLLTFGGTSATSLFSLLLMTWCHYLLAGLGTFWLAREHKLNTGSSMVAALAYMLSACYVRRLFEYWHMVAGAAWMPLIFVFVRRAMRARDRKTRWRNTAAAGLALGMSILTGMGQITYYLTIALSFYAILLALLPPSGQTRKVRRLRGAARALLVLLVIGFISGCIAAPMLLPSTEFLSQVTRMKTSGQDIMLAPGKSLKADRSPISLAKYASVYVGAGFEDPVAIQAVGAGAFILALAGIVWRRRADTVILLALFMVMMDCAIGPPMPVATIIQRIMPIQMAYPPRAMLLACLPLALLAGFGANAVTQPHNGTLRTPIGRALLVVTGAAVLEFLVHWFLYEKVLHVSKMAILLPSAVWVLVIASGSKRNPVRIVQAVLPVLIALETLVWNHEYVPYMNSRIHFSEFGESVERLKKNPEFWSSNVRGTDPMPNRLMRDLRPAMNGYDTLQLATVRQFLCSPEEERRYEARPLPEGMTRDSQRGNLLLKRSFWLAREYVLGSCPDKLTLFPPTTTVFLADGPVQGVPRVEREQVRTSSISASFNQVDFTVPPLVPVEGYPGTYVVELPPFASPKVHAALVLRYTTTCGATISTTFRDPASGSCEHGKQYVVGPTDSGPAHVEIPLPEMSSFEPTLTVELDDPEGRFQLDAACMLTDLSDENDRIRILARGCSFINLEILDLPGERILLFVDAAYPGWKASIDGVPTIIHRANDVFKAVVLGPGTHQVSFAFRPWRVYAGLAVSIAVLVGTAALLLLTRQPPSTPAP